MTDIETILSWFQTGDIPTEEHFKQTFSSFRNKNTKIPIAEVDGLEASLNNKANVDDIPDNMALVDEGQPVDVFNKEQIMAMAMMLSDYVKDGKIRADKIEALGLTDLIEAKESTLDEFVSSSNNYDFQQNDFIAIPVDGNFSLFIFKGGDKKIIANYLPTGLTNINISMVEGLQDVLNRKLEKPTTDGNYFINMSGNPSYKTINPEENHLLFWDGANFKNSSIFRDTGGLKFGIGTNTPSEQLHLKDRARMKALVLEDNSETLPQQLTYSNERFYGTDRIGSKRSLMYSDSADYLKLLNSLSDADKDLLRLANRKTGETYAIGQPRVDALLPIVVDMSNSQPKANITAVGINLFINNVDLVSNIEIVDISDLSVVENITNISVHQTLPSKLSFDITKSLYTVNKEYGIRVTHNGIISIINSNAVFITVSSLTNSNIDFDWNLMTDRISTDCSYVDIDAGSFQLNLFNNPSKIANVYSGYQFDFNIGYIIDFIVSVSMRFDLYATHADLSFCLIPVENMPIIPTKISDGILFWSNADYVSGGQPYIKLRDMAAIGNTTNDAIPVQIIIKNGTYKVISGNKIYVDILPPSPSGKYILISSAGYLNTTNTLTITRTNISIF